MLETIISTITSYYITFPLVFMAGFVDAVAGGGGLISLPAYMIAGLPVHNAIGTNKISSAMGTSFATYKYAKAGYINWKLALLSIVAALIGSNIGANLTLMFTDHTLKMLMLFILPATALFITRTKVFDSDKEPFSTRKTMIICAVIALFIGAYDGFYGPGTGTFLILLMTTLGHMKLQDANGISKAVNLTTNLTSLTVFLMHGTVLITLGVMAGLFNLAGSYIGVNFFQSKGGKIVKPMMLIVMLIFFVRTVNELFLA